MVSELPTMPMRLPLFGHIFFYARDPLRFFERAASTNLTIGNQAFGGEMCILNLETTGPMLSQGQPGL